MTTPLATDPTQQVLERLTAASKDVEKSKERAAAARVIRDTATVVAHLDHGVPPVKIYRDVLQCSRGLFVRIMSRAPAVRPEIKEPLARAQESAAAVRRHEAAIAESRAIRDAAALLLMQGGFDEETGGHVTPVSNADVARASGLTTARIAQLRTSVR